MKNIFNHNKHTSTQANQRTKTSVILKHTAIISILKNLSEQINISKSSLRAKCGNLYASVHSFQSSFSIFDFKLSTINYKLSTSSLAHSSRHTVSFSPQLSTINQQLLTLLPAHQRTIYLQLTCPPCRMKSIEFCRH